MCIRDRTEMGLTPTGTLHSMILCEMLDCSGAAATLIDLVLSDFGTYARLTEWHNPWLEKSFRALVQRVPDSELSRYPAPDFAASVGHVVALDTIASAPDHDIMLAADSPPERRAGLPCSVADKIKAVLKQSEQAPTPAQVLRAHAAPPHRRSVVRLREREKALAELRDKFYETPMASNEPTPQVTPRLTLGPSSSASRTSQPVSSNTAPTLPRYYCHPVSYTHLTPPTHYSV
eukprot:TRINITY_DN5762_c0_g2_i1.p1 TRINITY_DN5762_c0_g2~~TRINITY_DN5762_c0_g2_i1.p1  ORF type:complete len:233 (-),score=66.18 TRINITY_DN5762_c0_g2_i1:16-714(-)